MNIRTIEGYEPQFFTQSLRTILTGAGIDPDKTVKAKNGKQVRFVSPLGHQEGSMSAAIDMCILKGITTPSEIITALDTDPSIANQRKKFLRTKDEINVPDLLAKIDGHIGYYAGRNFDKHFTKLFALDNAVPRAIRKAARAYIETTWKPGLKEYKKALDAACVKVAEEVVAGENNTMALHQEVNLPATWLAMLPAIPAAPKEAGPEVPQETAVGTDTVEDLPIPVAVKRVCTATTKAGSPCKAYAVGTSEFCRAHTPKE
jgi:uncharacterized protein (UPF0147 family)